MGIDRTFRDINGIDWRVTPVSVGDESWLAFQAGWLERRLTPFPSSWQTATIQRLEQMCRIATPVQLMKKSTSSRATDAEPAAEATVDTTPPAGSDAVLDETGVTKHMSLLANTWPAADNRITFRG